MAAQADCQALDANLASDPDAAENAFLVSLATTGMNQPPTGMTWIGIIKSPPNSATYANVDGTPFSGYTNFAPGEPSGPAGNDCILLNSDNVTGQPNTIGTWNDVSCNQQTTANYICKKPL